MRNQQKRIKEVIRKGVWKVDIKNLVVLTKKFDCYAANKMF